MVFKSGRRLGAQWGLLCCAVILALVPSPGHGFIYAYSSNMTSILLEDLPALFGSPLPKDGVKGLLVESRPPNGCTPIVPAPAQPTPSDSNSTTKYIVLIRRYDCNFDIKMFKMVV